MKLCAIKLVLVGVAVVACSDLVMGYQLDSPTANLTEKYTTSAGWTTSAVSAGVVAGWSTNQNLAVQYAVLPPSSGLTQWGGVKGNANASSGIFSGNYSGMESLSADIRGQGLGLVPNIYIKCGSLRQWVCYFPIVVTTDAWIHVNLPLEPITGGVTNWSCRNQNNITDSGIFHSDLSNVVEVGFESVRDGNHPNAQSFSVDNLKMVGPWGTNLVDGIPIAWALEYGLTNDLVNVGHADADGDGFRNMAEFLAGTNPTNSSSFFHVNIEQDDQGHVLVKWQDNKYMTFDLLESSNLVSFSAVQGAQGIQGVGTQQVVDVGSAGVVGVRFYKVQVRQ